MINTINPEYTRQAIQAKYGNQGIGSFTYKPVVPVIYQWTFQESGNPFSDYHVVSNTAKRNSLYIGMFTIISNYVAGSIQCTLQTIDTQYNQNLTVLATTNNSASLITPFNQIVSFNKFFFNTPVSGAFDANFLFMGYFFEQP